jgi:bifunctional enzyme CysN/CysC
MNMQVASSASVHDLRALSPMPAPNRAQVRIVIVGHVDHGKSTPREICEARDPKGHYRKARGGGLKGFTGIDGGYQPPVNAELVLDTGTKSVADATDGIERMLASCGVLFEDLADLAANI